MRVVSLVNGSLLSEAASFYALVYARSVQLPLTLLFIDNGEESVDKVNLSIASLKELAEGYQVELEVVILEGEVLSQLRHYVQLYAVETLFCATRRQSDRHSFSQKIVQAHLETDVAVVKVKNVSQVRSFHRVLFAAGDHVHIHSYLLWLGLVKGNEAMGKLYLQNSRSASKASTKSGLKYEAAPFVQIGAMLGESLDVVNALQPVSAEDMNHYLVSNNMDLAIYAANAYPAKLLNQLTDESGINAILFYPWQGA